MSELDTRCTSDVTEPERAQPSLFKRAFPGLCFSIVFVMLTQISRWARVNIYCGRDAFSWAYIEELDKRDYVAIVAELVILCLVGMIASILIFRKKK